MLHRCITYHGPRDDQVYWLEGSFSGREYSAVIMLDDTHAPTPSSTNHYDSSTERVIKGGGEGGSDPIFLL